VARCSFRFTVNWSPWAPSCLLRVRWRQAQRTPHPGRGPYASLSRSLILPGLLRAVRFRLVSFWSPPQYNQSNPWAYCIPRRRAGGSAAVLGTSPFVLQPLLKKTRRLVGRLPNVVRLPCPQPRLIEFSRRRTNRNLFRSCEQRLWFIHERPLPFFQVTSSFPFIISQPTNPTPGPEDRTFRRFLP